MTLCHVGRGDDVCRVSCITAGVVILCDVVLCVTRCNVSYDATSCFVCVTRCRVVCDTVPLCGVVYKVV